MKQHIFKDEYKYPNLSLFFTILFFTYLFYREGILQQLVHGIENLGYFGIFLTGMFFVSTFTVAPAVTVLFLMLRELDIFTVSLIAGVGSMAGDYIIFRFIKDDLADELRDIFRKVSGDFIIKSHWIAHTRYFLWLGPVVGAIIIASPFPDELGVGLLGIYKLDNKKFLLLSWILNTVGLFLLLGAVRAVK